jgi:hypothetical protein
MNDNGTEESSEQSTSGLKLDLRKSATIQHLPKKQSSLKIVQLDTSAKNLDQENSDI